MEHKEEDMDVEMILDDSENYDCTVLATFSAAEATNAGESSNNTSNCEEFVPDFVPETPR